MRAVAWRAARRGAARRGAAHRQPEAAGEHRARRKHVADDAGDELRAAVEEREDRGDDADRRDVEVELRRCDHRRRRVVQRVAREVEAGVRDDGEGEDEEAPLPEALVPLLRLRRLRRRRLRRCICCGCYDQRRLARTRQHRTQLERRGGKRAQAVLERRARRESGGAREQQRGEERPTPDISHLVGLMRRLTNVCVSSGTMCKGSAGGDWPARTARREPEGSEIVERSNDLTQQFTHKQSQVRSVGRSRGSAGREGPGVRLRPSQAAPSELGTREGGARRRGRHSERVHVEPEFFDL